MCRVEEWNSVDKFGKEEKNFVLLRLRICMHDSFLPELEAEQTADVFTCAACTAELKFGYF